MIRLWWKDGNYSDVTEEEYHFFETNPELDHTEALPREENGKYVDDADSLQ